MEKRVAKPKKAVHSDKLDMVSKMDPKYAVRPAGFDSERWAEMRISKRQGLTEASARKHLIRDADHNIQGVNFPAKEMAVIIRGWMKQDEE